MATIGASIGAVAVAVDAIGFAQSLYASLLRRLILSTEGLSTVYEGRSPSLDIVCVHGIGGDASETWTTKTRGRSVNWIADFIRQDVPDARVLTYGYRADDVWAAKNLTQTLHAHANQLIEVIARKRPKEIEHRPIIFIAHSLGGLIVKHALVNASTSVGEKERAFKAIQLSTIGVLFFGTPQGDKGRGWKEVLNRIVEATTDIPKKLLSQPLERQGELFTLQNERYKSIQSLFQNHCFFEGERTAKKDKSSSIWIVPENIVLPDYGGTAPVRRWYKHRFTERSHVNLVKFETPKDRDYQEVAKCILQCRREERNADERCGRYFGDLAQLPSPLPALVSQEAMETSKEPHYAPSKYNVTTVHIEEIKDRSVKELVFEGSMCAREQQWNEAIEYYKNGLKRCEQLNGVNDAFTLDILNRLAAVYVKEGEPDKAELLYKRLFVALQEAYGICDTRTIEVLIQLAEVTLSQSHYAEATKYLLHVTLVRYSRLGRHHPDTLSAMAEAASLYNLQGKYAEAEKLYHNVIGSREKFLGDSHEDTLRAMQNLAMTYRGQGDLKSAAKEYEIILRRRKAILLNQGLLRESVEVDHEEVEANKAPRQRNESGQKSGSDGDLDDIERATRVIAELASVYRDDGRNKDLHSLLEEWKNEKRVLEYLQEA